MCVFTVISDKTVFCCCLMTISWCYTISAISAGAVCDECLMVNDGSADTQSSYALKTS